MVERRVVLDGIVVDDPPALTFARRQKNDPVPDVESLQLDGGFEHSGRPAFHPLYARSRNPGMRFNHLLAETEKLSCKLHHDRRRQQHKDSFAWIRARCKSTHGILTIDALGVKKDAASVALAISANP